MTEAKEKPFPLKVNEARGEVPLWIGKVPLVIAATMQGLAAVSSRAKCESLSELVRRLTNVEVAVTYAAVELLSVRGDVAEALEVLNLPHFRACADAFGKALSHHLSGEEGNGEAADAAA